MSIEETKRIVSQTHNNQYYYVIVCNIYDYLALYCWIKIQEIIKTYSSCCKRAIEHMENFCKVRFIKYHQILMKWNRTFCLNEVFPHPKYCIQHGYTYHSEFLETFPETKILISKWANKNLVKLNCKNVGI